MIKLLQHEFYKIKSTLAFRGAILLPILLTALITCIFIFKSEEFLKTANGNLWLTHLSFLLGTMGSLILPMYIIFLCFSINEIEHKADTWKNLLSLPYPKRMIFLSKLCMSFLLLSLFMISMLLLTILSGNIIAWIKPELNFQLYNINGFIAQIYGKMLLSSMALLCLQFFFSMLWSDFMKSMGLGLLFTILSLIAFRWQYIYLIPYAQPMYAVSHLMEKGSDLAVDFKSKEVFVSFATAVGFSLSAYLLMIKKSIR